MTDLKITPGPWEACVGEIDGVPVGSVHGPKGSNSHAPVAMVLGQDAKANAIAIAALPDLIEAAVPIIEDLEVAEQQLVSTQSKLGSDEEEVIIAFGSVRALRAALNKAKGEA